MTVECRLRKRKVLDTCYSVAYMSQTRDQEKFISCVAGEIDNKVGYLEI